jgi:hypothetical protein
LNGRKILLAGLVLAALGAGVSACGGDDDDGNGNETFNEEAFDVTFSYPSDFDLSTDVEAGKRVGEEAGERAGVGLDDENGIFIVKTGINFPVTAQNVAQIAPQIDALVTQVAAQPMQGEPSEVGGLPALRYPPYTTEEVGLSSRFTVIFDQATEYQLNCQYDDEHQAEVEEACDLALSSLEPK